MNSNQIAGLAAWQGSIAAATLGGIVLVDPSTGGLQKILSSPGGLPSNSVLCVAVTPSGSLWAGTADKGVARLKAGGGYRRTLTSFDGLPSDRVQTIYVHGDSVWVGTSGGVALFTENASGQIVLRRSDSSASTGGALVADNIFAFQQVADTLWCGTASGVSVFAGGGWINRSATLGVSVRALALHQGVLWAGTAAGPRSYSGGVFTIASTGHSGSCVALSSSGGSLFSGTAGAGGFSYSGPSWNGLSVSGLPSMLINSLVIASGGVLWAGTDAGIARYDNSGNFWTPYISTGPAVGGSQRAVADARGVWIATGNFVPPGGSLGCVLHYDGQTWSALTPITTGGSLQLSSVFTLLSDQNGKLWMGHCCSASAPRPRTERWDPATGVWDTLGVTNLDAFAEAPSGLVYGGSVELGSGVYVFDRTSAALIDSLTPLNTQGSAIGAGLSENNLRGIAFDTAGRGWFALANSGLDIWNGQGTTTNHADDVWNHLITGFPSDQTTCVVTTGASSGWVGTVAGLVRIRNDVRDPAASNTANAGLPSPQVKDLALDSGGNLWVATPAGIAKIDAQSGAVEHWGEAEGLVDDDVRALAWDSARGVLWVGTAAGISEVFPGSGGGGFSDQSYLYPNPLGAGGGGLRLGGITDEVSGEVRDLTGALIRRFECTPTQNQVWDLRLANGSPAASGIYLVVLRDGDRARILRAAVVR